jgi:tetratricopeptide (TPR) repeat protein
LSIRPLDVAHVIGAISAYRRVLQLAPVDEVAYDQLAKLYPGIGNYEDLAYIARMRLEHDPNDRNAPLWLADALVRLNKTAEARQTLEKLIGELEPLSDKHVEYVQACMRMSTIGSVDNSTEAKAKSLEWLNKAVDYAPESVEALASRARFYREISSIPGVEEKDRLVLARRDLESADNVGTDNPLIRCFLGAEWMAYKDFERAAAELKAADALPAETLAEHFVDSSDWTVTRFFFASQLAMRQGAMAQGASLADEALAALKEKRHRVRVLPTAIPLYVAVGKVSEARQCLDEYLAARYTGKETTESREELAYLQALVAKAENNWYAVIDTLQPVVTGDVSRPELWRLLAEAFSVTDQGRRAVGALTSYLQDRPGDPEMTLQLAKEYLRLRDWNRALETASLAEPLNPTDYMVRLLRVQAGVYAVAEQQQKPTAATFSKLSDELTQLRADHPDQVDIRILQAIIADYLEQPDKAEAELKLAVEQCKEPTKAEMQLVKHYYRAKRVEEATRVCQDACDHHPEVAEPWLSLSELWVAKEQYDAARACLRKGLSAATNKWEKRSLSIQLALVELTHGDRAAGIKLLSDLAGQDPQEIRARSLLLSIREVQEDQTNAQRLIEELKKAEGQNGLWWRMHQAALWLSSSGWRSKQQDITDCLRTCMTLDPEWSAPPLLLADMYEKLNNSAHVEDTCKQALVRNPSATEIADKLVTLLEKQKRFSDAEQILRQMEANPTWKSGRQALNALRAGDFSRAIEELRLRASNDNRDAGSRVLLARLLYWQMGDAAQALKYVKEAETIAPDSMAVTGVKAAILRADGQTAEARKMLDDYTEHHKDFSAYYMRASYLASDGQLERAEEDYKKLVTFPDNAVTGYQLLSNFYFNTKRLDQAVVTLEEGLKAHAGDLTLNRGLMRLLLLRAQGPDRERVLGILGSLEKQLPDDPELMKLRAMLLLENPTPESVGTAKVTLENVVKLEPTAVDAHLALIGLAMQTGEYQVARDDAVRALATNSNNRALLSARARAELALKNAPMAVELAHLVLQGDPNNTEAINILVEAGQSSNNPNLLKEVRTRIDSAVHRAPTNEGLLLARARILTALELPKAAIPELEAYCQTKQGGSSVTALVTVADLYRLTGDVDRSKQWIDQAQRLDPGNQTVIHARVLWLVSQGRLEELKGISSTYLSAKVQDPTILVRAASILAASGSAELRKEGLALFEHAAVLSPTSVEARLGLASTLYQTGDADRAQKIYREVFTQYPNNVQILNDLAWILQEHYQRYDEALKLANKGLEFARDDTHLLDTRATILSNMPDRLADAKKDFETLAQLSPSDSRQQAKALFRLGGMCAKLNDPIQAKQHLQKALEIDRKLNVFTPDERAEIMKLLPQVEK